MNVATVRIEGQDPLIGRGGIVKLVQGEADIAQAAVKLGIVGPKGQQRFQRRNLFVQRKDQRQIVERGVMVGNMSQDQLIKPLRFLEPSVLMKGDGGGEKLRKSSHCHMVRISVYKDMEDV